MCADETNVQGTATAGDSTSTVTTPIAGTTGREKNETTEDIKQPTAENTIAEAGSASEIAEKFWSEVVGIYVRVEEWDDELYTFL